MKYEVAIWSLHLYNSNLAQKPSCCANLQVCEVMKTPQCVTQEELTLTVHKSCDMMDAKSCLELLCLCVCACLCSWSCWCAANPREIRETQTRSDRHPLCAIRRWPMNEHPCKESSKQTSLLQLSLRPVSAALLFHIIPFISSHDSACTDLILQGLYLTM